MRQDLKDYLQDVPRLFGAVQPEFLARWHWFAYHARNDPPTRFMQSIVCACATLGEINASASERMLREVASIGGTERHRAHYDQLLQKLAEILVMQQVVVMNWQDGVRFEIEAAAQQSAKRVDIVASLRDGQRFGFEVKAPNWFEHAERRRQCEFQLPARGPDGVVPKLREIDNNLLLPRDNTLRDFLRSANEKFAGFKQEGNFLGILVVVWDDHIYEAIGPLINERNGLLTPASYSRVGDGPEQFPHIDGIIILRHLTYFVEAAAERPLPDGRLHSMHLGGEHAFPNVFTSTQPGLDIPRFITDPFNALTFNDPAIQNCAEYLVNEYIFWQNF